MTPDGKKIMNPIPSLLVTTRRHFFERCGIGLGSMALAKLLGQPRSSQAADQERSTNPLLPRSGHHAPRAKNVIFLFMAGGPSQFELFDYKPGLQHYNGQPIPASYLEGKRFAFMDTFNKEPPKLLGTRRKFARHGESGAWVSECLPHTARVVDDLTFVKSVWTEPVNHAPAKLFMNSGTTQFGRPSLVSWCCSPVLEALEAGPYSGEVDSFQQPTKVYLSGMDPNRFWIFHGLQRFQKPISESHWMRSAI